MADHFGRKLLQLRSAQGLSLRQLGDLVDLSPQRLHDYERGERPPPPTGRDFYDRLECALGEGSAEKLRRAARKDRQHLVEGTPWHLRHKAAT